jgi:lipopolysaccharide/colanic/teichoic acid biosynthesis glycosyltransferase
LIAGDWRQRSEVVLSSGQADNRFYNVAARTIDVGFAIAVLLLLWWLLLVIAILVRLDSAGSPIFAQPRVGRNGALFTCYKFRTMSVGTPHVATHEAGATSVTRIGRFLRRSKLDELLQVVNLIPGHLSLIGPRPCLSSQTELIEARTKLGVLRLRPGISGLSQIMDIDMSGPERLACYDARYVGMQSLVVDLNIILWTAMGKGNVDRIRI